jgi:cupin fold WbuC family metalloprotein
MSGLVQLIDPTLLDELIARALQSTRLRANHNFHQSPGDNPHRFLNALARGTYCAPHRHVTPPKAEAFIALRGEVLVFIFGDAGEVVERHSIGLDGLLGVDIPAGVWHSIAAVSPTAVCYEVKPGPWDPQTDKQYAPWAPREGDDDASDYLQRLLA